MERATGRTVASGTVGQEVGAFVPFPLPPREPELRMDRALAELHAEAKIALDRLSLATQMVPSVGWFLYGFVRKEAVITSEIEGTQATLLDVVVYEATEETDSPEDVEEVCNYVAALKYARGQLAGAKGLPISVRLLCEAHKRLMKGARGSSKAPGQIRRVQNWIGGNHIGDARFVPPPPEEAAGAMSDLEKWIHGPDELPPLVRAGLAHVQFETIHPFLDGNGRIGRLLIALLLQHWGVLAEPLLYISVAFRRRQNEYYKRLSEVRTSGDWEGWTRFYLECVHEAASDGVVVAARVFELVSRDRRLLLARRDVTVAALRLLELLPEHPVVTVSMVVKLLGVTAPTARKAVTVCMAAGILKETSGRLRDRVFRYEQYLQVL